MRAEWVTSLRLSPATTSLATAEKWLEGSGNDSTDGVVAKQLDGPYVPGERMMIKVKRIRTAECVVGGFRYGSKKREVGSLLLGLYDTDGKLHHVGFTSSTLRSLSPKGSLKLTGSPRT